MTSTTITSLARLLAAVALATAVVLVGGLRSADAQTAVEVHLTGDNANNFFVVTAKDAATLEFCTDLLGCFERPSADIERIVIDGLDGDDGVFVSHRANMVTNTSGRPLSLVFVGGAGNDELRVCTVSACSQGLTTTVTPLPETDEVRIVQCLGRTQNQPGGRCLDQPFQAPVPTLKINARGTSVITDMSPGPLHVAGTPDADTITTAAGPTLTNTAPSGPATSGEIRVGQIAALRVLNKDHLVIDGLAGADVVRIATRAGLVSQPTTCARDGAAGVAGICVTGGEEAGDRLQVADGDGVTEPMTMATRFPGITRLSGTSPAPTIDATGIDEIELGVQPDEGDALLVTGTPVQEVVRIGSTMPDVVTLTGHYATNTGVPAPLPQVTLTADGSGPIAVTVDGLGGGDRLEVATGQAEDLVTVARSLDRPECAATAGTCVVHHRDGVEALRLTALAVATVDIATADGSDTVALTADIVPPVVWRGGPGSDRLALTGTGAPMVVDQGISTLAQDGHATHTVTEVESQDVDVAGSRVTVRGTDAADTMRYAPSGAYAGTITMDGDGRTLSVSRVGGVQGVSGGTLELDPAGGDDTVAVDATTGGDHIAIFRGAAVVTQVGETLPVRAVAGTESLVVNGRSGDDRFVVNGEGGTATITVDGGVHTAGDRISFAAAQSSAAVTLDAAPASGTLAAGGPAIAFRDLEHIDAEGDDAGSFTVSGSDTHDTIVQSGDTVTVGRGTTVAFSRYPTLVLAGLAGNDDVVVEPRTLPGGVTSVQVAGGDAGTDSVLVRGTALRETIVYEPRTADGGVVQMSLAPDITVTGLESVLVDGRTAPPSGDTLLVRSPAIPGTILAVPGAAVDAGTISLRDATGGITSFPPLHYGALGRGGVVIDGADAAGVASDRVAVRGEVDTDVFVLTGGTGDTSTTVDTRIPVTTTGVHTLLLEGLDGQDTFHLPAAHGIVGATGPAVLVDGGPPSGGDVAVVTGRDSSIGLDLAASTITHTGDRAIAVAGLDRVDVDAVDRPVTVVGGGGPDRVTVRPTGSAAAQVTSDLDTTLLALSRTSNLLVSPGDGTDLVAVEGRTVADAITVQRGSVSTVTVGSLLGVRVDATTEALRVEGREGGDTMVVDGSGGPSALVLDGGSPAADGDLVRVVGSDIGVDFAVPATAGAIASPGGAVAFEGMDGVNVVGDDTGTLTVRGTDSPDTITLGEPGTPTVRVNTGAAVTHAGYPALVVDGRGGADVIDIAYDNLGDLDTIHAAGGSSADDRVQVTDRLGATRVFDLSPLDADHATVDGGPDVPVLTTTGTSMVTVNGRDGADTARILTPDGAQDVVVTPTAADAARVRVGSLLPFTVTNLTADGALVVNDPGAVAEDHVLLDGSPAADRFRVDGPTTQVRLDDFVPLTAHGAVGLTLRGFDGSDEVIGTGPLPWVTTTFEGGGPDDGDHLSLDGPTGDAVVDIGNVSVTGYGGTVRFPEVSTVDTSHADLGLTVLGTGGDDAICYDPMTPRSGRVHLIAQPGGGLLTDSCQPSPGSLDVLHGFVDVGRLDVDPGDGADQVLISGTVNDDAVVIESTGPEVEVVVNPNPADTASVRLPVHIVTPTTENVIVATDNGVDQVDVRLYEALAPVITVHGEAPDTRKSDEMTVRDLSGGANMNVTQGNPNSSGTVVTDWRRFSGIEVVVNYTGMEDVRTLKGQRPKDGNTRSIHTRIVDQ